MASYQIDTVYIVTFEDTTGAADCVLVRSNNAENAQYKTHDRLPEGWKVVGCDIATPEERKVWDHLLDYDFS